MKKLKIKYLKYILLQRYSLEYHDWESVEYKIPLKMWVIYNYYVFFIIERTKKDNSQYTEQFGLKALIYLNTVQSCTILYVDCGNRGVVLYSQLCVSATIRDSLLIFFANQTCFFFFFFGFVRFLRSVSVFFFGAVPN